MPKSWFKLSFFFLTENTQKLNFLTLHREESHFFLICLDSSERHGAKSRCRSAPSPRSSFICVIEGWRGGAGGASDQRLLGLEPLYTVVNSERWLSSLTERKSSCIVLARPLVYKNLSPVDGLCLIQFSFVCKSLVLFVFFRFSCCVTLRVGPSLSGLCCEGSHPVSLRPAAGFHYPAFATPFDSK